MAEATVTTQTIVDILVDLLKEEGSLLLATIPDRLKPIDYKLFSGGKGLKAWLLSFPEFAASEDGLCLLLAGEAKAEEAVAPAAPVATGVESAGEARCMHKFSFMNYWNQNLKMLRALGDFSDVKSDQMRDHVAHVLMRDLLTGGVDMELDEGKAPQLILNTQYTLPSGHPIYAVFGLNPVNTDGTKQLWAMKGLCSTDPEDRSQLADWIRGFYGQKASYGYGDLQGQMDKICEKLGQIKEETERFREGLLSENCPVLEDGKRFSRSVFEYEQLWEQLEKIVKCFPALSQSQPITLAQLQQAANRETVCSGMISQALDAFQQVCSGLHGFFVQNRWAAQEDSTALQDAQKLRQLYANGAEADPGLKEFKALLGIYGCFRQVVSTCEPDDAYYENVDSLRKHFAELKKISLRNAAMLLCNIPEGERPFFNALDDIDPLLDQYVAANEERKQSAVSVSLPASNTELLTIALAADKEYKIRWPQYMKAALPEDAQARDVILQDDAGVSLTCGDVADRLLAAGMADYAERYYILGLLHESERCVAALLQMYRQQDRNEAFEAVWSTYCALISYNQEDEFFRFGILCAQSPQQALEMAQSNMHLQYQPDNLTKLADAAKALGNTELENTFRQRLEKLSAYPQPDALETAVIGGDWAAVAELTEPAQLEALGLNPSQIQRVQNAMESGDYPTGNGAYEIGVRLYTLLGNRNGRAEQWLWQGLPEQGRGRYAELLLLLAEEKRWDEAVALYETNKESQKQFEDCRRLYLLARYSRSAEDAQGVFVENLHDALMMMTLKPSLAEKFREAAQEPKNAFYDGLLQLHQAVSAPYLWSVVCEDRSLRERVFDQTQMDELGLDAAVISETYRAGRYSHGRDAQSIAERLYALAGNLSSAAELAARLAGNDPAALQLLWTIYSNEGNEAQMYGLLETHEDLRQEHEALYLRFVYAREEYGRFLTLLSQWDTLTEQDRIRRATAEMALGKELTELPEDCAQAARSCAAQDCEKLLGAAAEGYPEVAAEVICACFDQWLAEAPERLRSLVSCSGAAPETLLAQLQAKAVEHNILTLAVYLQNVLKIGNVPEQAELLYSSLQAQLQTQATEEQLICLQKLQYIYPEQSADISLQAATISLQILLDAPETANKKDVAEKMQQLILSLDQTPEMFAVVTQLLKGTVYCLDYRVYTAIYDLGKNTDRLSEALQFLHETGMTEAAAAKPYFRENLIKFYYSTLLEERFPVPIAWEAEQLCLQALEQTDSVQAALSICMLELLLARPIYAKAVMNHLLTVTSDQNDTPKEALRALGVEEGTPLMELADALPNSLELFEQVLNLGSDEELLEYLQFCGKFTKANTGSFQELRNLRPGETLSESQSILAVGLLCSDPKKPEYWDICARISFDAEDIGRAVFLGLCCKKKYSHWKEYVQLCETLAEAPERLPAALAAWAAAPNGQSCREYIEKKLEQQPSYLEQIQDSASLCRMTDAMCRPLKEMVLEVNHGQLGTVALIAVSTGDPGCLKILQRDAGHLLFGSKSDLGVVVLSKLLLAGRFDEAEGWLANLQNSVADAKYRALIDELAGFNAEALRTWSQVPSTEQFLRLIPHDGNRPNMEKLAKTVAPALLSGEETEMAEALVRMLRIFPDDYAVSHELFELSKTGFEGYLPLMHFSLVNLCRVTVDAETAKDFDDRSQKSHMVALAILNQLLISTRQTELITDGWNFEQSTAQGLEEADILVEDHALLAETERMVRASLNNQAPEVVAMRSEAWFATITGNWTQYLDKAFRANQQPEDVFLPKNDVDGAGVTRSVLLLLHKTEQTAQGELKGWLSKLAAVSLEKRSQIKHALSMEGEGKLARFGEINQEQTEKILRFPADNSRLFRCLVEDMLRSAVSKGMAYADPVAHILCAIGGNRWSMYAVYDSADECFRKGQDDLAWTMYDALYKSCQAYGVSHAFSVRHPVITEVPVRQSADETAVGEQATKEMVVRTAYFYNREEYQAKMRISGAFIGQQQCVAKLADPNMNPWTLINLVLCIVANRADEIWRLEAYMDPQRAAMAEHIRLMLSPDVDDEEKILLIEDTQIAPMDRYYMTKMLGYPYPNLEKSALYFLKDIHSVDRVSRVFNTLYHAFSFNEKKMCKKPLLCKSVKGAAGVSHKIREQKDPSLWETFKIVPEKTESYVYIAPGYVAQLAPIQTDAETLEDLQQQYQQLAVANTHAGYCEKAKLSEELYRRTIGAGVGAEECYRALVRYSVDRFYDLISDGTQPSKEQAFRMLLELLETDGGNAHNAQEHNALAEMINVVGVVGLFKSYPQIRLLCEDYANKERAFAKLRGMLRDNVVFQDTGTIYEVLKDLNQTFNLFSSSDVSKVIRKLKEADSTVSAISGTGGVSVKGHLQRLIRAELSDLSRRAILEIQLLNRGEQSHRGNLTGVVLNKGTIEATDLTLQAFYEDGGSARFVLGRLLPNSKAIFEIPYDASATAGQLTGKLDLSGKSGKAEVGDVQDFTLTLGQTSGDKLLYRTYSTERPGFFVFDQESRTVKNGQFFGRFSETDRMRELVSGDRFEEFRSAVVYGVRRTGKTALLEYFKAYVNGMHPDCMCFRVDVQLSEVSIHGVFIAAVLKEAEVVKALESCPDREIFVEKWQGQKVQNGQMDPILIRSFFKELKELTGRGVVLIIDEIDRLFKKLIDDHTESALNELLRTISGLLDDEERRSFLQLVICGSNWLMHYNDVGHDMQQMFHRFGDEFKVGNLPPEDVYALLDSAQVNYAPGTKELIWEYTGGLVWFVKLLANEAICRAKEAKRSWVYPADVAASLGKVVSEQNCQQFYEGCEVGSLERVLIDAMQSLAYRKDMYLHVEKICDLVGKGPGEVKSALDRLKMFEIVEFNPVNPAQVRFRMDIYRRFFRSVRSAFPAIPGETDVFEVEQTNENVFAAPEISETIPQTMPEPDSDTVVYLDTDEL